MSDKSNPPDANPTPDDVPSPDTQDRFEERYLFFMNELQTKCKEAKIPVAVAIILDPETDPEAPLLFTRGHIYDQARILAAALRRLRRQMDAELDI